MMIPAPASTAKDATPRRVIALEARLRACRNVDTLGVRPNLSDYPPPALDMIKRAQTIYYPSPFYAELFDTVGKRTFPGYHTYKVAQDKIKQTALLDLLGINHPRTRVFYGKRQQATIDNHFTYPFIAKIPRGSALGRGVYLIRDRAQLRAYCLLTPVAYIQAYLPVNRDIRVVVIGGRVVHAYWRLNREGEFRGNVAQGSSVCLDPVPEEALELARNTATACRWDDVGIDLLAHKGRYYVVEANMKYGREGFRQAGLDYIGLMEDLIANGDI
jgi:ribosomal protein S6--L-glutamate ligase